MRGFETIVRTKEGGVRDVVISADVVMRRDGRYYLHFIHDVTKLKETEEALRKAQIDLEARVAQRTTQLSHAYNELRAEVEARRKAEEDRRQLVAATENAAEAIIVVDASFRITYVNPAFTELTGYQAREVRGMDLSALRAHDGDPAFYDAIRAAIIGSKSRWSGPWPIGGRAGGPRIHHAHISAIRDSEARITHYVIVAHDITDQLRREEQVRQGQKLQAIGTLAGGIAHDFNNILAIILGNAELAGETAADEATRHNVSQIFRAAGRGRDLIKQIMAFSRKTVPARKTIRLGRLIRETYRLLRASLPTTVKLSLDLGETDDRMEADETQVQQILLNLTTNAAQAIEGGGEISIGLSSVEFPPGHPLPDSEMQHGRYLKITVTDTGRGMPEAVRKRIFEPFFTTKEVGRGSGMGLAVAYGIAKGHGGAITAKSAPGRGSTFEVFLPGGSGGPPEARAEEDRPAAGSERILFVDDEPDVARVAGRMLERLGYRVTLATDGSEAWEKLREDPARYDLVITDQTMPDLTGLALARRIGDLRPGLPVVICTGYSDAVSPEATKEAGVRALVFKPLTRAELARTVRSVLEASG